MGSYSMCALCPLEGLSALSVEKPDRGVQEPSEFLSDWRFQGSLVTLGAAPSTLPFLSPSPRSPLFLLSLHQGLNRHSYSEKSAVAGRGGREDYSKQSSRGTRQSKRIQPLEQAAGEGGVLLRLVLKETAKT